MHVLRSDSGGWQTVSNPFEDGVIDSIAGCTQSPERVYALLTAPDRLDQIGDLWAGILDAKHDLQALLQLVESG